MDKRRILIFCMLLFLCGGLEAQVSGYQGKRFILSTDLMSPLTDRSFSVHGEVALFRNISFNVDYRRSNKTVDPYQTIATDELAEGAIKSEVLHLGMRYYTSNVFPAPYGFYVYSDIGYGVADIEGQWHGVGFQSGKLYDFKVKNTRVLVLEPGFGYQWIKFSRLVIDVGIGWNITSVLVGRNFHLTEPYQVDHGPNLGSLRHDKIGGRGFSAHSRIGVLLF